MSADKAPAPNSVGFQKKAAPRASEDREFIRGLGLRWLSPKGGGYLGTVQELQDAFTTDDGNTVYEASRILGEAHASGLRSGKKIPAGVQRQIMKAAYSQDFEFFRSRAESALEDRRSSGFASSFTDALCLAKEAFRADGDGRAFQRKGGALRELSRKYLTQETERLGDLQRRTDLAEYLSDLNGSLPTLVKHYDKLPPSPWKRELEPKIEALMARAIFFNRIFLLFGIDSGGALKVQDFRTHNPYECEGPRKLDPRKALPKAGPPSIPIPANSGPIEVTFI